MIYFVVPWNQTGIINNLRKRLPKNLSGSIHSITYHRLAEKKSYQSGTYIFTGLEVLTSAQRETGAEIWNHLENAGPGFRLMNHPINTLNRYELLNAAYEKRINRFSCYKAVDFLKNKAQPSYPVFVREAGNHTGSLTTLIRDRDSVLKEIERLEKNNYPAKGLLIVEFIDTSDDYGLFKKYSAFKVGDAILPRYLSLSYDWVVKENEPDPVDKPLYSNESIQEELSFIQENPHEKQLREIFRFAKIDYGRIDYGLMDGIIQVWEINTLPSIGRNTAIKRSYDINERKKKRAKAKAIFYEAFSAAIQNLENQETNHKVSVRLKKDTLRKVNNERIWHKTVHFMIKLGMNLPRFTIIQRFRTAIKNKLKRNFHG